MYRRLKTIYFKMGVRNRTQALLKASRLGWIQ
jgi:DNA-binding CsgD family transcriptional regulator